MLWTDVSLLTAVCMLQSIEDVNAGRATSAIPAVTAGKSAILEAAINHVFAQMNQDRKTTALKSLQVCPQSYLSLNLVPAVQQKSCRLESVDQRCFHTGKCAAGAHMACRICEWQHQGRALQGCA